MKELFTCLLWYFAGGDAAIMFVSLVWLLEVIEK